MATDDDDAATLRERVRELEQTVAQQQDTIQQLMPSRRAILAGGAGLVGGAALTGQASAQSAAGQVGTSSEPVDVEAATVTADSVNTDDLGISDTILTSGSYATVMGGSATEDLSDVTSTSYTAVGGLSGVVNTGNIPAGATLYGEFYARGGISDGTETLTARPALINGRDTAFLSEFEVSTQSTGNDTMTSGPIEVTTDLSANDFWQMWRVEAKVTGGTGSFVSYLAALSFYWRVD